jgi:hypothetical protein
MVVPGLGTLPSVVRPHNKVPHIAVLQCRIPRVRVGWNLDTGCSGLYQPVVTWRFRISGHTRFTNMSMSCYYVWCHMSLPLAAESASYSVTRAGQR